MLHHYLPTNIFIKFFFFIITEALRRACLVQKLPDSLINYLLRDIHESDFLVLFITEMLGNRLIRSNLGGYSIVKRVTRGSPQTVFSPLLWPLVASIGLRLLESRGFKVVAYGDDVVIMVGGKFLSTLGELMEPTLTHNWSLQSFSQDY